MTTCGEYVLLNHIKYDLIIMTTKLRLYKQYMILFLKYVIGYVNTIFWLATSSLACNCIELRAFGDFNPTSNTTTLRFEMLLKRRCSY